MENPFYIDELRPLSGSDQPVRDFVLGHPATRDFLDRLMPLLEFALPRYEEEKKARLGIAFDRDRAVAATGATERDAEARLLLLLVARQRELEQRHEPVQEVPRRRMAGQQAARRPLA